jgi:uncharacterized protein (TIGR00296 family)
MSEGAAPEPEEENSLGSQSVRLARRTLEELPEEATERDAAERFRSLPLPPEFDQRMGVFVSLFRFPSESLRGCIGFPQPVFPLRSAIPRAAHAAAREDPRFSPVSPGELPEIIVEVSLLTVPEPLAQLPRRDLVEQIRVGRDGLIVEGFGASGLLLPQVAPEQGWDAAGFLDGVCEKAGLPAKSWLSLEVRVLSFQARIFRETHPRGPVAARNG